MKWVVEGQDWGWGEGVEGSVISALCYCVSQFPDVGDVDLPGSVYTG